MARPDLASRNEPATPHDSSAPEAAAPFVARHIGPSDEQVRAMLDALNFPDLAAFMEAVVPRQIRAAKPLDLPQARSEFEALQELRTLARMNRVCRSFIGLGYHDCITPPVIQRNILENPGWYTQYTPYQAEIAQGRLEALLNFQTAIIELTGMDIANASMLDEATAAAEAMTLSLHVSQEAAGKRFLVSSSCHPQTIDVVRTRALPLGIEVVVETFTKFDFDSKPFAILLQYPATDGAIHDYAAVAEQARASGALVIVAADLLALALLKPPGEFGADIVVGNSQRFGVPLGYGGPHAAFFATRDAFKRHMPGRLVGISKDAEGKPAYRLALQTREQHIRREKATSNICTAQVLLAIIASMYAVYHGPEGIRRIARGIRTKASALAAGLRQLRIRTGPEPFFDTVRVELDGEASAVIERAERAGINLRQLGPRSLAIALDETVTSDDLVQLWNTFASEGQLPFNPKQLEAEPVPGLPPALSRTSPFLTPPVFHKHHSETAMLRYIRKLESRDLSLTTSMIPLGSCTMKLNATSEMLPISWPEFARLHPFAPRSQAAGYTELFDQLEAWLAEITGFDAVSLQPNAGSQGEYAGLLAIWHYHRSRGDSKRSICLIPQSAHGTNPASAVMAGFRVVPVACDDQGNVDLKDLRAKAELHAPELGALMITYPSTHGVFEEEVRDISAAIHQHGGQVYLDGANMNAQTGICRPAELGADVCHLNLHKTFCIPHGGGGPGMGPICVKEHLAPFLPNHPIVSLRPEGSVGAVSAAPWGSPSILPIPWMYIRMMGAPGLMRATQIAILNANYIARRLEPFFPVLYKGKRGCVAHECILDLRQFKSVTVEDVAKRLMDFSFHAPTISWPVPGTLMIEPTESEGKEELDRFCDALILIQAEIKEIESGHADSKNNLLKNAPHTAASLLRTDWSRPYPRERAAYPAPWLRDQKFWPHVARIDNVHGDRNLVCSCIGMEAFLPAAGGS